MAAGYNLDYLFVLHAWNISDDTTDSLTIACPVKQDIQGKRADFC